ncbi:MAG: hypothetical protein K6B52_09455 [Clostridiales bacterium]|nr:hypothetical protein [Clostridiales bacterium]
MKKIRISALAVCVLLMSVCFSSCRVKPNKNFDFEELEKNFSSFEESTTAGEILTTTQPETITEAEITSTATTRAFENTTALITSKQTTTVKATDSIIKASEYYSLSAPGQEKYGVSIYRFNDKVVVDRMLYSASYNDLLPAARSNRSKYSRSISEILRITNEYRAAVGASPLKLSDKLCEIAGCRAEEVAYSGKYSHNRPNMKYFSSIFTENGYNSGSCGENLAWHFSSADAVCAAWKNSETHYQNMIDKKFTKIGIGVAEDPDPTGALIYVQHFYGE